MRIKIFWVLCSILTLSGCMTLNENVLGSNGSQVSVRNYQSRTYDTNDRQMVLRNVLSTMQDLGFIIDKADETLGTITGTSFTYKSKLTVSVRQHGKNQILVRANAQRNLDEITDPIAYQNFFNVLSNSLFLDANMVE